MRALRSVLFAVMMVGGLARAEDFALPPIEQFSAIIDQPVFNPARHDPTARAADVQGATLRLTGILHSTDGHVGALIEDEDAHHESRVGVGAVLNGWHVDSIQTRTITVSNAGHVVQVSVKQRLPPRR